MKQKTVGYVIMWGSISTPIGKRDSEGYLHTDREKALLFDTRKQANRAIQKDIREYHTEENDYQIYRVVKNVA